VISQQGAGDCPCSTYCEDYFSSPDNRQYHSQQKKNSISKGKFWQMSSTKGPQLNKPHGTDHTKIDAMQMALRTVNSMLISVHFPVQVSVQKQKRMMQECASTG
jgi:hypothetical protein